MNLGVGSSGYAMWLTKMFQFTWLHLQTPKCKAQVDGQCPIHFESGDCLHIREHLHSQCQTPPGPLPSSPASPLEAQLSLWPVSSAPRCLSVPVAAALSISAAQASLLGCRNAPPSLPSRWLLNSAKVAHPTSNPNWQGHYLPWFRWPLLCPPLAQAKALGLSCLLPFSYPSL